MENASMSTIAPIFSCGMELGNALVASDVLTQSWETNNELSCKNESSGTSTGFLRHKISHKPNCNIIALVAPQIENLETLDEAKGLISTKALDKKKFPFIDLCFKNIPFSIHPITAVAFESVFEKLDECYTKWVHSSAQLVITGYSLAGSVASLFTLWLLGRVDPKSAKLPLCVTFGAPLVGDDKLYKAISQRSSWESPFIHVVGELDPVPRYLAAISDSKYKPFGTYLLISQSGGACFNDPESVNLLLKTTYLAGVGNQYSSLEHYGQVVGNLRSKLVINGEVGGNDEWAIRPQCAGIASQMEAIGISRSQQWHQFTDIEHLSSNLRTHEQMVRLIAEKRSAMDPLKKLNDMKTNMANLEWYKKKTQDEETGYYDSFKNSSQRREYEVKKYKTLLTKYWKDIVAQAEQKPQAEGRLLRTRYIGPGTNYRRMVEPLDIAEHYKENDSNYIAIRPDHYTRLEEWLDLERVIDENNTLRTAGPSLTEDSCFWGRVEQAKVWINLVFEGGPEVEVARNRLLDFENYVWSLVKDKTVSSDIFLRQSSFMKWWKDYSAILPPSEHTAFTWYMRSGQYVDYK